jgi:lipopolysaccharide biosynthesis glycosyltransferase
MDIVFNINRLGLEGLGATLTSLIRNCTNNSELKLWFLCSDFLDKDKENLTYLLTVEEFKGKFELIDFDAKKQFGHLRSLHGDWTTYGRLLIPSLIASDRALYLDADLVILADLLELKDFNFSDKVLAAVYGAPVDSTLDKEFFYSKLKWKKDVAYFNAGVILFNLKKWREENYDNKIEALTKAYPNDLISHDQTLLNAISKGDFALLPNKFNTAWYPGSKRPKDSEDAILHFIGAPKPWDLFGQIVHDGYATWKAYNLKFWKKEFGTLTIDKLYRTWKIRRSLLKHLKHKFIK